MVDVEKMNQAIMQVAFEVTKTVIMAVNEETGDKSLVLASIAQYKAVDPRLDAHH